MPQCPKHDDDITDTPEPKKTATKVHHKVTSDTESSYIDKSDDQSSETEELYLIDVCNTFQYFNSSDENQSTHSAYTHSAYTHSDVHDCYVIEDLMSTSVPMIGKVVNILTATASETNDAIVEVLNVQHVIEENEGQREL